MDFWNTLPPLLKTSKRWFLVLRVSRISLTPEIHEPFGSLNQESQKSHKMNCELKNLEIRKGQGN
jgi:hypothetical protein